MNPAMTAVLRQEFEIVFFGITDLKYVSGSNMWLLGNNTNRIDYVSFIDWLDHCHYAGYVEGIVAGGELVE